MVGLQRILNKAYNNKPLVVLLSQRPQPFQIHRGGFVVQILKRIFEPIPMIDHVGVFRQQQKEEFPTGESDERLLAGLSLHDDHQQPPRCIVL